MALKDKIFKTEKQPASLAERRAASLPTHELLTWTENAVITVGRCLDHYRNTGKVEDVMDAESAGQTLQVLLEELRKRAPLS